jgi:hypothetical protein
MKKTSEQKPLLEEDTELLLAQKLEQARKAKEAESAAAAPATAATEEVAPTTLTSGSPEVDDKELMYIELEKMGCSRNYITKMKERYGTVIVYPHEDNKWFVVRPLKVKEMKMIREIAGADPEKLNKEILESACIFPKLSDESVADLPAGLPDLLVNMISRLSAFIPVELAFSLSKEL